MSGTYVSDYTPGTAQERGRRHPRRSGAVLAAVAAVIAALLVPTTAAAARQEITSAGPLERIVVTDTLACMVFYAGAAPGGQFHPADISQLNCGTVLVTGGVTYSFDNIDDADLDDEYFSDGVFTPVSQSPVTGSGTREDPYRIVTVVDAGTTGLRITETTTYVVGEESYRTDIQVTNLGTVEQSAILYQFGDCYTGNTATGRDDSSGVATPGGGGACVQPPGDPNSPFILELFPLSPGSSFGAGDYANSGGHIDDQEPLANVTSPAPPDQIDSFVGLSWNLTLPAGATATRSLLTTVSADAELPIVATKSVAPGGFTLTFQNRSDNEVTLDSITDVLPAGFSYRPGTTSGATTANPTINGQTLTWQGPFAIAANSTITLTFGTTAGRTSNILENRVLGSAGNTTVVEGRAAVAACQGNAVSPIAGTAGDDTLVGTPGSDAIYGLAGNDDLDGVDGADCLFGDNGDDILRGGADRDIALGGADRDKVRGQGGKDRLKGQAGKDRLNGGEGKDRLAGGAGKDKMRGGAAKDRYKGGAGNDRLNAVDAKVDRVNCGSGKDDKATVDPIDRVSRNCETVREVEKD